MWRLIADVNFPRYSSIKIIIFGFKLKSWSDFAKMGYFSKSFMNVEVLSKGGHIMQIEFGDFVGSSSSAAELPKTPAELLLLLV